MDNGELSGQPPHPPSPSGRLHLHNLSQLNLGSGANPLPSPRKELRQPSATSSPSVSHRSSFADNMRGMPPSPRLAQRTSSFSHQAVQELINNPPVARQDPADVMFGGRDWRTIGVGEVTAPEETRFVEVDTSVEDATKLLITSGAPNVVLIREHKNTRTAIGAFDYDDLNAYLLLVTNLSYPANAREDEINHVLDRAGKNQPIPLSDIKYLLGRKEPPAFLEHTDSLTRAVELFGGGVHRIIVRKQGTLHVVGVLSQVRLVRFFWENMAASFRAVDALHNKTLKDLHISSHPVLSINGDRPLKEALSLMHTEGVTSLPVLDSHKNVIGNISHVDVKLLTTTTSLPLLDSSCTHFISVILSERGMYDGQDSYPVFHVTPFSTLAHTVAKLVATRSHRMWIVDAPSPASSVPPSPALGPSNAAPPPVTHQSAVTHTAGPPYTPATPNVAIGANSLPGATLSGRLSGVISLTDVLHLYARVSGLSPQDPHETRRRRRRSSSSSLRASLDGQRGGSMDIVRGSTELGRSGSGRR